jgi:tetratricopeptide (TPR) repeat protein
MSTSFRRWLALFTLLAAGVNPLQAQDWPATDRPKPFIPLRATTPEERDQRESLKHYALGLICQREDRLIEALSAFEMAATLDAKAAPVQQALIPMYLALDRTADALAATRKALELDADSYETWYLYARQLRSRGDVKEAAVALGKALGCSEVRERPEVAYQFQFDLGVLHEQTGAPEKAAEAFNQAVKLLEHIDLPPEQTMLRAAETHERVGRIWVQARKYDRAVAAFRKAQAAYPDSAGRLNFNLAQVCQQQGQHAEALRYIDAYLKEQPQGTEAYELKVALLGQLDRSAEVVPWLEKAAEADRFNVRLKMLLARQYTVARLADRAEKAYADLAAQAPTPEVYQGLVRLYLAEPKLGMGKAVALFDRTFVAARDRANPAQGLAVAQARAMLLAVRDDPEATKGLLAAADALGAKAKLEPETLQALATLAERTEQLEQAEKYFRGALQVSRGSDEEGKPVLYAGLLKVLWKVRKYAEVAEVCREALRTAKDADCIVYQAELARALTRLERYDEAVRAADSAVTLASATDRLGAQVLRVRILIQAGFYDRAEKECLGLLRERVLPGELLEVRYALSSVYSAAKRLDRAEEQLLECLKLDPDNATLNNDLGYIWADQKKNLVRAEEMIRKAIELDRRSRKGPLALPDGPSKDEPDNAAYIDSLGWVLFRKGDVAGARRELERAAQLPDGEDPVIWEHLGDVYLRLGLRGQARTAFERAVHFYERDRRGKMDGRYNDLQQKLKLVGASAQP